MKFTLTIFLALASVAQGSKPHGHEHFRKVHKHHPHKTITGSTTEPPQVTAAPRGTTTSFSYSGPVGSRGYNVYTPAGYSRDSPAPLIVVLHGCTQSPSIIAANSNFGALADENQFVLAFPSETEADNYGACWDWYGIRSADQSRDSGEPAIIAGITQTVQSSPTWNIDKDRTYITGLSAGAAMSVIVGVTYPDVFAAIGANSGLEYKAATSYNASRPLLTGSPGPNPVQQGQVIKQAMGSYARRRPTLVFHGTADTIVPYIHGVEIAISMASANALVDPTFTNSDYLTPNSNLTGHVPNGHSYHAASWNDECNKPVVQFFTVLGMDHRWSGGALANVSGADVYTDPKGPSFTRISYNFFMSNPMHGDRV